MVLPTASDIYTLVSQQYILTKKKKKNKKKGNNTAVLQIWWLNIIKFKRQSATPSFGIRNRNSLCYQINY